MIKSNRISSLYSIYKKSIYEGFPFLSWFENDPNHYDKNTGRLYIPFEENFATEDNSADVLNDFNERVYLIVKEENPEFFNKNEYILKPYFGVVYKR